MLQRDTDRAKLSMEKY